MIKIKNEKYLLRTIDGAIGLSKLPDKSVKLIYGSPPYPNAKRNYGVWSSEEYIKKIEPFIKQAVKKLQDDGFLVINIKANRDVNKNGNTTRSLVVERLAILLEEKFKLHCVDIEIWVKSNPVPTGIRSACQDSYEQNLWFAKNVKWEINLDSIRTEYPLETLKSYEKNEYKPRSNGTSYVSKAKKITAHPIGALPKNVMIGAVSSKVINHQAVQPEYISKKYILACTKENDLVVDPWVGSGTTGVVALKFNRRFIGFDVSDEYTEFSKGRFEEIINNEDKKLES